MRTVTRRSYTDAEKAAALALYEAEGPTAVQDQMGIAKGTVAGWARTNGVRTRSIENASARVQAQSVSMAERKLNLAAGLMDDIERLRVQLWASCTERKAMVVSDGAAEGSHVEIVDIDLTQPTFGDQKSIMTSLAIAVDKVQILTGDVTARTETIGQVDRPVAEERVAKLVDLAARRTA